MKGDNALNMEPVSIALAALLAGAVLGISISIMRLRQLRAINAKLAEKADRLERIAKSDPLTGIYNRRYLSERVNRLIEGYRKSGVIFTLAMVDIDFFKRINDSFGHQTGDQVLKKIASAISSELGPRDIFGRYGGEEFLIIFEMQSASDAVLKLEAINSTLERTNWGVPAVVTISSGVSEYDGCTYAQLLTRVDKNLYAAKNAGRNCIRA